MSCTLPIEFIDYPLLTIDCPFSPVPTPALPTPTPISTPTPTPQQTPTPQPTPTPPSTVTPVPPTPQQTPTPQPTPTPPPTVTPVPINSTVIKDDEKIVIDRPFVTNSSVLLLGNGTVLNDWTINGNLTLGENTSISSNGTITVNGCVELAGTLTTKVGAGQPVIVYECKNGTFQSVISDDSTFNKTCEASTTKPVYTNTVLFFSADDSQCDSGSQLWVIGIVVGCTSVLLILAVGGYLFVYQKEKIFPYAEV